VDRNPGAAANESSILDHQEVLLRIGVMPGQQDYWVLDFDHEVFMLYSLLLRYL
jgi:hypothetical protein